MATVIFTNNSNKQVTNLGWLLRHWRNVDYFTVLIAREDSAYECILVASLKDLTLRGKEAQSYVTAFASSNVLVDFLDRPVFRSLLINWYGEWFTIGTPSYSEISKRHLARA